MTTRSSFRAMPRPARSAPTGRGGARRGGQAQGLAVEIVRTGSRGLFWLEPLVEVETPAAASPTAR